jgi:transcriptional regulator with XRE-family HTH domain
MADGSRQRGNDRGPTAATVAENVKRVRNLRRLTQEDLSRRLYELGRRIPPASVGKIELGLRAVEVDDLMAIAIALDVSPLGLLLPMDLRFRTIAAVTGTEREVNELWDWAVGAGPLEADDQRTYLVASIPGWFEAARRSRDTPSGVQGFSSPES